MTIEPREHLKLELANPEFAEEYGADQAQTLLALALVGSRHKLKLTQQDVANRVGASQPYIAKLERGDANPTIGKIGGMLALLGLRLCFYTEDLLGESPQVNVQTTALASIADEAWNARGSTASSIEAWSSQSTVNAVDLIVVGGAL